MRFPTLFHHAIGRALAGALCSILFVPALALAEPVAEVLAMRGFASLIVAGVTKPLKVGGKLEEGWEIRTSTPGRVKLRFIDGSVMVIGDSSRLKIDKFKPEYGSQPRDASFMLDIGLVSQTVAPSANGQWSVRTPSAVTAVRGTEYVVEVKRDKMTEVHVQTGAVSVEPTNKKRTRNLDGSPRAPLILDAKYVGTTCSASGECTPTKVWKQERVQALADRLSGV